MAAAEAIVVGAGPAGIAAAQRFKSTGLKPVILEKSSEVGAAWRRHYDRLHLHTRRRHSGLPGMAIPRNYGRYPSQAEPGLYFVGALASPTGRLREIRLGATRVADSARQFLADEDAPGVFAGGMKLNGSRLAAKGRAAYVTSNAALRRSDRRCPANP
jgi:hypothetical protein